MAFAAKLRTALAPDHPAPGPMPRVYDDAEFAAASAQLGKLRDCLARLERRKMDLVIARELEGKAVNPRSPTDTFLRAKLASLRADPTLAPAASRHPAAATVPSSAIATALAVADGAPLPPALDHGEQLAEIDRLHAAVRAGIFEANDECDRIANEVSYRLCLEIQPRWDRAQLAMFHAAEALAAAAERVKELRREMVDAGIRPLSHVIRMAPVRSPLVLGSETDWNSEIAQWARLLGSWGLL